MVWKMFVILPTDEAFHVCCGLTGSYAEFLSSVTSLFQYVMYEGKWCGLNHTRLPNSCRRFSVSCWAMVLLWRTLKPVTYLGGGQDLPWERSQNKRVGCRAELGPATPLAVSPCEPFLTHPLLVPPSGVTRSQRRCDLPHLGPSPPKDQVKANPWFLGQWCSVVRGNKN